MIRDRERERYEKRVGTVVAGRWRIDSLLGHGATSAVYAATHRNGHRAALKILHASLCGDATTTERFLREAGIANAIKHRAIVPIGDDGTTDDGCAYLVLELLEGETLEDMRERGGGVLPLEEIAPIAEELMSAIAAVHAAGVIHRDLKPGNVFMTKAGHLKLLDFGTARIFDRAPGSPLSMQGLVIGTPSFMSPEQARGARSEVDAQSDVWSLGALMFTVLSGELVHPGKDDHERLLAAASKPARSLSSVAPAVDARVIVVIDRALAHAKADRWPDVQSMRIALRTAVLASVPTLRDLKAYAEVASEPAALVDDGLTSSDPTIVCGTPFEMEIAASPADSAPPPSLALPVPPAPESSPRLPEKRARIPIVSLVVGLGAMAAVLVLVVFFVTGGDVSTGRSASSTVAAPVAEIAAPAAGPSPSSSFIVIEAPDLPAPAAAKPPAWSGAVAPKPKPAANAADAAVAPPVPSEPSETSGSGGQTPEQPGPKGGPAPATTDVEPHAD